MTANGQASRAAFPMRGFNEISLRKFQLFVLDCKVFLPYI
jgi:hypothetical protein